MGMLLYLVVDMKTEDAQGGGQDTVMDSLVGCVGGHAGVPYLVVGTREPTWVMDRLVGCVGGHAGVYLVVDIWSESQHGDGYVGGVCRWAC